MYQYIKIYSGIFNPLFLVFIKFSLSSKFRFGEELVLLVKSNTGCTVSSIMQDKNRSKFIALVSGTLGGFTLGIVFIIGNEDLNYYFLK